MTDKPPLDLLRDSSLFLDFDGTLVESADRPDAVEVSERLTGVLDRLGALLPGRLAVISGRPVSELRAFLDGPVVLVGSQGMEFEAPVAGAVDRPPALDRALEWMRRIAALRPALLVEDKPLGVVLHYRQEPEAEEECVELAAALAREHGLHLQHGKMMIEVRAAGGDKGTALRALMREPGMAGTRPVFMGDDLNDEPAFVAAADLGGAGVLVGERRETAAQYRLSGVEAALAWLEAASAEAA